MKQVTPRRDGYKQAAVARRLNATATIAPHVLNSTVAYESDKQVIFSQGHEEDALVQCGAVLLRKGERFYLIASKFAGLYYVAVARDGRWLCSSSDERVAAACIAKVQAYRLTSAA